jgi:hypothetical protein
MADRFKRKTQGERSKQIFDSYLVVCEGETEVNYLKGFKRTLSREQQRVLKIEPVHAPNTDCLSIVRDAIKRKDNAETAGVPYKEVWVFFDDDNQSNLQVAFSRAKAKKIKVAFSSISLEFWFLLHFQFTTRQFTDAKAVEAELKNHWTDFTKPAFQSWDKLENNIALAILNGEKLRKGNTDQDFHVFRNPYTNVDLMLTSLGYGEKLK